MNAASQILYRINSEDEIVFVNSNWSQFALDNDAPELVSEKVLQRNFWNFISDETTHHIYRMIVQQARAGHSIKFKFRCDAPALRRLLEMNVSFEVNGDVQFSTNTIRTEKRPPQNIIDRNIPRMDEVIIICSWCNKIKVDEGDWQEIEEFIKIFGLSDFEILPQPSHGMCDACYKIVSEKFQK